MSKFKVGDKVRVVKARDNGYTTNSLIGKEGVASSEETSYDLVVDFPNEDYPADWVFYDDELELVAPEPTFADEVEAIKKRLTELEAQIVAEVSEPVKKAAVLPVGSVIKFVGGIYNYVKVDPETWVNLYPKSVIKPPLTHTNYSMDHSDRFEVIREGI